MRRLQPPFLSLCLALVTNMSKLRISLVQERPDEVHYSGNIVRGNLLLDVNKPKSYRCITIKFTGISRASGGNSRRNSETADANSSTEPYVDLQTVVWDGKDYPDGKLTPGQHSWPFSFAVPQTAPSSFEGAHGSIRYTLEGRIVTSSNKSDHKVEARVPVRQLVVYADPELLRPQHQEVTKRMKGLCCCGSQPIVLRAVVPKTTFYTGETLELQISLENESGHRIALSAAVKEDVKYTAADGSHKWEGKTVATLANTEVEPRSSREWKPTVEVPEVDVVDEGSCDNIRVTHSLIVNCKIPRTDNLFTVFPLKISNWRPVNENLPPPTNPQLDEPYPQPPNTTLGLQPHPYSPSTLSTAPPGLPPQPLPTGTTHNVSMQHQQSPGPLSATLPHHYNPTTYRPPPSAHPVQPQHRPLVSGGVPTPYAVAKSQWNSAMSLS